MRSTGRLTNAIRARKKAVAYIGAAAALAGAGTAGAASFAAAGHSQPAAVVSHSSAYRTATPEQASQKAVSDALSTARHAVTSAAQVTPAKGHVAAKSAAPVAKVAAAKTSARAMRAAPAKSAARAQREAAAKSASPAKSAARAQGEAPAKSASPAKSAARVQGEGPAKSAARAQGEGPAKSAAPAPTNAPAPAPAPQPPSWQQIQHTVAKQTSPSEPQAANQLQPTGTAGPQAWMPISPAQQTNATTIVQQALNKGMGLRSAVIAVATSMQESQLQNINYGDQDSLGLFQQRPSMGWGTAQQITTPSYAADAFLTALKQQQASNPGWAQQPLWANAQAVQKSGFPFAYAKWETQAVQLVKNIVTQVK
jgi:hypothetical protein